MPKHSIAYQMQSLQLIFPKHLSHAKEHKEIYFWQNKKNHFCDFKGLCATLEILRVKKMFWKF